MQKIIAARTFVTKRLSLSVAILFCVVPFYAHAEHTAVHRGQLLYENHCQVCHDSTVHIREHHKAKSSSDVQGWVIRWQNHLKLGWTMEEVNQVTDYLSETFYKFNAND